MPFPKADPQRVQFEKDMQDVFVHKSRDIEDFSEDYGTRLRDAYRFSAWRFSTSRPIIAPRTDTMDII